MQPKTSSEITETSEVSEASEIGEASDAMQASDVGAICLPAIAVQITKLCFAYPQLSVLTDLSATVRNGVTLVQGGDGQGKTTFLRLLAGEMKASSGQLNIGGIDLINQPLVLKRHVFWIDPRSIEFDAISPRVFWQQQGKHWPNFDAVRLPALIEGLSLTEFVDKPLYMLSTGSKRKVWLAAAFASNAPIALLDDPFAALDKPSIRYVTEVLGEIAQHASRAVVISGYAPPDDLPLAGVIDLGG